MRSKVLNSFAHLVQHRTTKLCSRFLNNVDGDWPSHKVSNAKNAKSVSQQNEGAAGVEGYEKGEV